MSDPNIFVSSSFNGAITINSLDSFSRLYYLKTESADLKIYKFVTVKDFVCVYSSHIKVGTVQGKYKRLATNPTGAVYSKETVKKVVALAAKHQLVLFADEIYDKILYDGTTHHTAAGLSDDILIITMGGLSKNYRAAGFRGGWMILTGAKHKAKSYIEGLNFLFSTRLCANVITQYGIQTALGGYQSINDLVAKEGRLNRQMNLAYERINAIDGVSVVKPKGALYLFPKIDLSKFNFEDDNHFVMSLLEEQKILVVGGQGFNIKGNDHFRIVFLPHVEQLGVALDKIALHFENYRK